MFDDMRENSLPVGISLIFTITFHSAITRVTPLSILTAGAPPTIGKASERSEFISSDGWPEEGMERLSDDKNEVRFFEDGLNTGARILGR